MNKIVVVIFVMIIAIAGCGKKQPTMSPAKKLLIEGQVYLKQGDVQKALESFSSSIKADPKNMEGYYILSEVLIHLKQPQAALGLLQTASKEFPDQGAFYFLMGVAYDGMNQIMPAIVAVRKSLDLFMAQKDQEGAQRSSVLLTNLIEKAKALSAEAAIQNAQNDAQKINAVTE